MVPERITDVMDSRAQVWVICNGPTGDPHVFHDVYSVLACFEGEFAGILEQAGWVRVVSGRNVRYLCPECAKAVQS